jgi:hypothetical protein
MSLQPSARDALLPLAGVPRDHEAHRRWGVTLLFHLINNESLSDDNRMLAVTAALRGLLSHNERCFPFQGSFTALTQE